MDERLLTEFVHGRLEAAAVERVEDHVDGCTECFHRLGELAARAEGRFVLEWPIFENERYELRGEHGRGGIGVVLRAHDRRLGREVALKLLSDASSASRARFAREAGITARLQHPSIVAIHDVGRLESGTPGYTMPFYPGRSLREAIQAQPTLRQRLGLMRHALAVSEAMAHAHARGVLHRDLKPSNVLLGELGETVLIDWGLAKLATDVDPLGAGAGSAATGSHPDSTRTGAVLGTPSYMPPEQARGEPVGKHADVYSLGAILYHLVAGRPPFEGNSSPAVLCLVRATPPTDVQTIERACPDDLAALIRKAMAPAPADRYPDAGALADELRRWIDGGLVGAHDYSRSALVWRFVRRHRAFVAAALIVAIVGVVSATRVVGERDAARASAAQLIITQARAQLTLDPTATLAWLERYPDDGTAWSEVQTLAADAASRGISRHVWHMPTSVQMAIFSPDGRLAAIGDVNTLHLRDVASGKLHRDVEIGGSRCMAFSADGHLLLVGTDRGLIVVVEVASGRQLARLSAQQGALNSVGFTADAGRFISAGMNGPIRVWRLGAGGEVTHERDLLGHVGVVEQTFFDSAGRLWSSGQDGTVRRWDLVTGATELMLELPHKRLYAPLAVAQDGSAFITSDGARVLMTRDGATVEVGRDLAPVRVVAMRADGGLGVTAGDDGAVTWWDRTGQVRRVAGPPHAVVTMALSVDGEVLAVGDVEGAVRLWSHGAARSLLGHSAGIDSIDITPDGQTLLTASADFTARAWTTPLQGSFTRVSERPLFRVEFVAGDRQLLTASKDGGVRLLDRGSAVVRELGAHTGAAYDLALVPDQLRAMTAGWDGTLSLWDLVTGTLVRTWTHGAEQLWSIDVSPDGKRAVTAALDGDVRLWELDQPAGRVVVHHAGDAHEAIFSPDGKWIASTAANGRIELTDWKGGARVSLVGHEGTVGSLVFARDGQTLFTGGYDGTVRAWNVVTGAGRLVTRHRTRVRTIALSPDGKWLASGGEDHEIQLHHLPSGPVLVFRGHAAEVRHLAFSKGGEWLASAGWDATVRLWHVPDGRVAVLRGHVGFIHRVAFSGDDHWLASAGDDGMVGVWPVADTGLVPVRRDDLRVWFGQETSARVDETGALASPR